MVTVQGIGTFSVLFTLIWCVVEVGAALRSQHTWPPRGPSDRLNAPLLQATRGHDRADPLNIATPGAGLRPVTEFPPDDRCANGLLGQIIGGLYPLDADKGPEHPLYARRASDRW